jgi:hypothetical protein
MMRLVVIGLMVGLTACDAFPDGRICTAPPPLVLSELSGPNAKPVVVLAEDCIHRWGYRLAKSPDEAPVVADAVMAVCDNQNLAQIRALADTLRDRPTASRLVNERNRALALAYVVQARAGNCAVPS